MELYNPKSKITDFDDLIEYIKNLQDILDPDNWQLDWDMCFSRSLEEWQSLYDTRVPEGATGIAIKYDKAQDYEVVIYESWEAASAFAQEIVRAQLVELFEEGTIYDPLLEIDVVENF